MWHLFMYSVARGNQRQGNIYKSKVGGELPKGKCPVMSKTLSQNGTSNPLEHLEKLNK